ncbi:MAG: pectinacetylesterase family protein [Anaerolineae bacterium]|jgi:hypothetical protein|nr:pectinacetylesterase family protein [Anaerolineae bacterium]
MARRVFTAIFGCLGLLVMFVVGGGFLLYSSLTHAQAVLTVDEFHALEPYTWARIDLSDQTQCSDGTDYRIYARRGESDNLLVHFVGGGAAWDAETSAQPITLNNFEGFYFANIWDILRAILDGVFSTSNPENPFHTWNAVYIPYCTADFHIGSAHPTYQRREGDPFTLHHNGRQNVTEALAWVFETFPAAPEKLVVSGESAGAFGSLFWLPTIAAQYPASDLYHIGDGSYLNAQQWPQIVGEVWQANTESLGFTVTEDLIGGVYRQYAETTAPNVTYLHINTIYDEVLIHFNAYLDGVPNDADYRTAWSAQMRASMQAVDDTDLPYFYFLTDHGLDPEALTTPHTSLSFDLFYAIEQDDIRLSDWVYRLVMEGERFSVGSELMGSE